MSEQNQLVFRRALRKWELIDHKEASFFDRLKFRLGLKSNLHKWREYGLYDDVTNLNFHCRVCPLCCRAEILNQGPMGDKEWHHLATEIESMDWWERAAFDRGVAFWMKE